MRFVKLLDSYVVKELLQFTLIFLIVLFGVIFSTVEVSTVIRRVAEMGMPVDRALCIVVMHLPEGTIKCLPAALMTATLLVFHRMCLDSEMVALLTSGVSFLRVMRGVLIVGLAVSLVSFLVSEYTVPQARQTCWRLIHIGMLQAQPPKDQTYHVFTDAESGPNCQKLLFIDCYQQECLQNVTVLLVSNHQVTSVINAAKGRWEKGLCTLTEGAIYDLVSQFGRTYTKFGKLELKAADSFSAKLFERTIHDPAEFNTGELKKYIDSHGGREAPPHLLFQLYQRFSRPLASFFILLAATPLALGGRKARTWKGIVYGSIVLCIYYTLVSMSSALMEHGRVDPLVAAWLPNLAVAALGVVVIFIKSRASNL